MLFSLFLNGYGEDYRDNLVHESSMWTLRLPRIMAREEGRRRELSTFIREPRKVSGYEWMTGKRIVHPHAGHEPKKTESLF